MSEQTDKTIEDKINLQYDLMEKEKQELFLARCNVEDLEASIRIRERWIGEMEKDLRLTKQSKGET